MLYSLKTPNWERSWIHPTTKCIQLKRAGSKVTRKLTNISKLRDLTFRDIFYNNITNKVNHDLWTIFFPLLDFDLINSRFCCFDIVGTCCLEIIRARSLNVILQSICHTQIIKVIELSWCRVNHSILGSYKKQLGFLLNSLLFRRMCLDQSHHCTKLRS